MRASDTYDLAEVALNWNRWRDTQVCVESLYEFAPSNADIVVCDNGCR